MNKEYSLNKQNKTIDQTKAGQSSQLTALNSV